MRSEKIFKKLALPIAVLIVAKLCNLLKCTSKGGGVEKEN